MATQNNPHAVYIRQTYDLARQATEHGDHPFGALLVYGGQVILTARNTVNNAQDITGHAELNLVRQAGQHHNAEVIAASTLYTSTEPCAMCSGAIYWAGISQVIFGCSAAGLSQIASGDFLVACTEIFKHGQRPVTVIGPVLEDEGLALLREAW